MEHENMQAKQHYDPDRLLASLISKLNLKNDAALSRALEVSPPVISKIRHRRLRRAPAHDQGLAAKR